MDIDAMAAIPYGSIVSWYACMEGNPMMIKRGTMSTGEEYDYGEAQSLVAAMKEFKRVNADATINQFLVFVHVARYEGCSQRDLLNALDMNDGTVSRVCAMLSDRGNRGSPGLDLIKIGHADDDYRRVALRLMPKGRALFKAIVEKTKR